MVSYSKYVLTLYATTQVSFETDFSFLKKKKIYNKASQSTVRSKVRGVRVNDYRETETDIFIFGYNY